MLDANLWQRFTHPAKRVVDFAQEEAKRLGTEMVGSEHLLLGILREGEGVAAHVLERLGVGLDRVSAELERQVVAHEERAGNTTRLFLSSNAKKALDYALLEARELNPKLGLNDFVDTEHLLLGLILEGSASASVAVHLLTSLGVDIACIREEVLHELGCPSMTPASQDQTPTPRGVMTSQDNMWQRFTNPATRVIHFAQEEAKRLGMNVVGTEHILLGLVREGEGVAARVLERLGVSLGRVRSELARQVGAPEGHVVGSTRLTLSPKAKKALEYAQQEARELNTKLGLLDFVDTEHLLLGLVREGAGSGSKAVRLLEGLGVDLERVRKEVMNYLGGTPSLEPATRQRHNTPTLDAFELAFTKMAMDGGLDPVIGREQEMQRVMQILGRRTKNNPVLIGEPGVGKTAIMLGLAQRIIRRDVPESLGNTLLVHEQQISFKGVRRYYCYPVSASFTSGSQANFSFR